MDALDLARSQNAYFDQNFAGLERNVATDLRSTDLVRAAELSTTGMAGQASRSLREARRYGVTNYTPIQRREMARNLVTTASLERANTLNNMYMGQYERNKGLRDQMMNIGRGLESQSMDALISSSNAAAQREMAGDQAREARRAQNQQTAATVASALIIAFA